MMRVILWNTTKKHIYNKLTEKALADSVVRLEVWSPVSYHDSVIAFDIDSPTQYPEIESIDQPSVKKYNEYLKGTDIESMPAVFSLKST